MTSAWLSFHELSALVGEGAANAFCRAYGGVSVYIPKTGLEGSALAPVVGLQALEALSRACGGMVVTVPNRRREEPLKARVIALLEEGRTARDIALTLGVTQRYVEIVRRTALRNARQLTLF